MSFFSSPKWDIDDASDTLNKQLFGCDVTKKIKKLGKEARKEKKTKNDKKTNLATEERNEKILFTHVSPRKLLRRQKQKKKKALAHGTTPGHMSNTCDINMLVNPLKVKIPSSARPKKKAKEKKKALNGVVETESKYLPINHSSNKSPSRIINVSPAKKRRNVFSENNVESVVSKISAKRRKLSVHSKSQLHPSSPSNRNHCETNKTKKKKSVTEMPQTNVLKKKQLKKKTKKENFKEELISLPVQEKTTFQNNPASSSYVSKLRRFIASQQKHTETHTGQQKKIKWQTGSLRERMMQRLQASRFRYLNEQMYNSESSEAQTFFQNDPDAFQSYHEGYRQQVSRWPLNPLDKIINSILKKSTNLVVADFGCGDARLSRSIPHTVHSFDLVALCEEVTACDMAHTPLTDGSVDIAVFCLSLMGTNLSSYLIEANRVLKQGGVLKIAEVESRFENVDTFIQDVNKYGFSSINKDLSHNLFYFMDFKKEKDVKKSKNLPYLNLKPCLYKKR